MNQTTTPTLAPPMRELLSRFGLTPDTSVKHIHASVVELDVALVAALKEWGPAQVADITGVSPALQRQWRKQRVLTPLTDEEGTKRTRFNVLSLSFVWAARVLIDNGAGHKAIDGLVNHLGYEILNNALRRGRWDIHAPVSEEAAARFLSHHPMFSMGSGRPFFALRNDEAAIDHPERSASFFHLESIDQWLRDGFKSDEVEDVAQDEADRLRMAEEAEQDEVEEELEEDEDDGWEPPTPPPPLPPGRAAVIIDVRTVTQELLERLSLIIGEVYDNEKDEGIHAMSDVRQEYDRLNAEVSAGLNELDRLQARAEGLPPGAERDAAIVLFDDYRKTFLPRYDEVEGRLDRLMTIMKLHLAYLRATHGGPDSAPDPEAAAKLAAEINQLKSE